MKIFAVILYNVDMYINVGQISTSHWNCQFPKFYEISVQNMPSFDN